VAQLMTRNAPAALSFLTATACAGVTFCEQYELYKMLYNRREKGG